MGEAISLYELNSLVKQTLKERFAEAVWITAEIASIQENRSGHCYLELADKAGDGENVVAVAKGTIWAFTFRMLKPYFETTTGRHLEKGMRVLIQVEVIFHELYGYSLNIKDIDPTFTVGDLERKKREIIEQLEQDGIIDMNRELEFPLLPKTIAIISSPTAAGLGDFINQLENNQYGYHFHTKLFPALMQGEKTTESVIAALDRIYEHEAVFDVVVIIRGGGSQTDLGYFDTYDMAANVAQFPLPVIAGIGHERDETIVDRVAWMKVKTPTAAAAFLIETFLEFDSRLEELKDDFTGGVEDLLQEEQTRHIRLVSDFKRITQALLNDNNSRLELLSHKIQNVSRLFIRNRLSLFDTMQARVENRLALGLDRQKVRLTDYTRLTKQRCEALFADHTHKLELAAIKMKYVDPKNVLERGYSITRLNGKVIRSLTEVKQGDILETELTEGKIQSIVSK